MSFGQNQGLVWSSNSSLWGNQVQEKIIKFWTEPRPCMVHGLKPMGKPSTKNKSHKFWTEPRSCMVLGLKPMGKPSTGENHKFWTEPRPCMVHGLKPMGKPTTCKEKLHCMEFGFIRGKISTSHWVSSQVAGILKSAFRTAAPKGSMQI